MCSLIVLENNTCKVVIEKGELVSFLKENNEYIHQKENKGWESSDDEMFPIIGRTKNNNHRVITSKGNAILDQHGLLRELDYTLNSNTKTNAKFTKNYSENTLIKNSRFPDKSSEENIFWPYSFSFEKNFTLKNNILKIDFLLSSEKNMPFMFGYHPAFLLSDLGNESLICNEQKIELKEVLKAGANAYPLLNANKIILKNNTKNDIEISTKGFDNFMLWTEVNNMICIEPITIYPVPFDEKLSEKNMILSKGKNKFSVEIKIL